MSHAQHLENSIDTKAPPAGVRLELGSIASALGVSVTEMAEATGVSRVEVFAILAENVWPRLADTAAIRAALRVLMAARGGSDEQISILFDARVSTRRHPSRTNYHGNPPGYLPRLPHEPRTPARVRPPNTTPKDINMLLPKQTLAPAARKAFRLFVNPFDGEVCSEDQMFTSPDIAYVREACMQAAMGGRLSRSLAKVAAERRRSSATLKRASSARTSRCSSSAPGCLAWKTRTSRARP